MTAAEIIQRLGLSRHPEGGYFVQTYGSSWTVDLADRTGGTRPGFNTIFYLLTREDPVGHFHVNRSDIVHYFHMGSPLTYLTISPEGHMATHVLGPDLSLGHQLQLVVPANHWKATVVSGEFGLLSEAVAPGFDVRDREIASAARLSALFPHLTERVRPYVLDAHTSVRDSP